MPAFRVAALGPPGAGTILGRSSSAGLEQRNHNPRVGGSSPSSATNKLDNLGPFGGHFPASRTAGFNRVGSSWSTPAMDPLPVVAKRA